MFSVSVEVQTVKSYCNHYLALHNHFLNHSDVAIRNSYIGKFTSTHEHYLLKIENALQLLELRFLTPHTKIDVNEDLLVAFSCLEKITSHE